MSEDYTSQSRSGLTGRICTYKNVNVRVKGVHVYQNVHVISVVDNFDCHRVL